jgi:hypothetical protein
MKKLIFLLLMAVLVGFVSAGATHPPWASGPEMADIALAEYGVHEGVVTQPTVLVMPVTAEQSFQAVMALYESAILPHSGFIIMSMSTGQFCTGYASADYHMRC